jgi:hypothetical protein
VFLLFLQSPWRSVRSRQRRPSRVAAPIAISRTRHDRLVVWQIGMSTCAIGTFPRTPDPGLVVTRVTVVTRLPSSRRWRTGASCVGRIRQARSIASTSRRPVALVTPVRSSPFRGAGTSPCCRGRIPWSRRAPPVTAPRARIGPHQRRWNGSVPAATGQDDPTSILNVRPWAGRCSKACESRERR